MTSAGAGELARWRPFVCVGLAYFVIGVIVPALLLKWKREQGNWTARGVSLSLAAGALGALGALGIILAFNFGGKPVFVMPLVFGGAPVVNSLLTIYLAKRVRDIGPLFLAGLVMVILGSVTVMLCAPKKPHAQAAAADTVSADDAAEHPPKRTPRRTIPWRSHRAASWSGGSCSWFPSPVSSSAGGRTVQRCTKARPRCGKAAYGQ